MKIREAFPDIHGRTSPIVRPEYSLLTILYLLRMEGADVVPITLMDRMSGRAVYGSSVLFKATQTGPAGFANLLRGPCLDASDELSMVSEVDDVEALLGQFKLKRLGFAFVYDPADPRRKGRIISLTDVLSLYSSKVIQTGMTFGEVASPIVSMPGETRLGEALRVMYHHSYRRVFLSGSEGCIYDRQIMDSVFSPLVLEGPDPEALCRELLAEPISRIEKTTPGAVDPTAPIPSAATMLMSARGGCVTIDGQKLATPWDAVMKPWLSGNLRVA